ncbi:MAG: helix-turn-helix domain-containing protein [Roseococcus sp.]
MSQMMTAPFDEMRCARRSRLDEDVNSEIGRRLRAQRRLRELTLLELSAISGLTVQQIQRSEAGTARITVVLLLRLADALKTSPLALMPCAAQEEGSTALTDGRIDPPDGGAAHELAMALANYLTRNRPAPAARG